MSMDFVYDLTEKLKEQKIDFFLITIRKGKTKDNGDIFYYFQDDDSIESCQQIIQTFNELEQDENEKPKKSPRKNRRKKDEDEE
jgi:hypothetical protein